jgi:hypothetical protein
MPTSNTACFQVFLDVLARKFARQDILLVLDGAPAPALSFSRSHTGVAPLPAHVFPDLSRYLIGALRPFCTHA